MGDRVGGGGNPVRDGEGRAWTGEGRTRDDGDRERDTGDGIAVSPSRPDGHGAGPAPLRGAPRRGP
jgi:hypothetical protein